MNTPQNISTPRSARSSIPSHSPSPHFLQNILLHTVTVTPSSSLLGTEAELLPNIQPEMGGKAATKTCFIRVRTDQTTAQPCSHPPATLPKNPGWLQEAELKALAAFGGSNRAQTGHTSAMMSPFSACTWAVAPMSRITLSTS